MRERLWQTLLYEAGGIAVAAPAYGYLFEKPPVDSLLITTLFSLAFLIWTPIFNHAFDAVELRTTGRVASDRQPRWRIAHAVLLEGTDTVLTVPLLVFLGGHGLVEALLIDLGLGVVYMAYAYAFFAVFDHFRPVR
jgi:uncharacterized membrane protein